MARIYRRSDRITVKIDDVTVRLAPLTLDQKTEIQTAMLVGKSKGDIKALTQGIALSVKYSLKAIEGVEDSDGKPYQLNFDGENLSQDCVEDLMNSDLIKKLNMVCVTLVNGIPVSFNDHEGNPIDGVELVKQGKDDIEKKS